MPRGNRDPAHIAKMVAASAAKRLTPLAVRYWAKVDKRGPDECWPWLANKNPHGYGQIYPGPDRAKRSGDTMFAHHVALELAGIEVPVGKVRDHICKDRGCQNPAHIRIVTQQVNTTENSECPHAHNARKTHCNYGHPLEGDNLKIIYPLDQKAKRRGVMIRRPSRVCRECQKPVAAS